jgi:orotidine-5'-phosphate decarboxylase
MKPHERIFVALDTPDRDRALVLARALAGRVGGFKIGLEAFAACGPSLVGEVLDAGLPVFLDLKLHDIPNTVAGAAAASSRLGVSFLTVHALGGAAMIRAAVDASRDAAASAGLAQPTILAVTILTSHDERDLEAVGIAGPASDAVLRLAALARDAGAGGAVCSPLEVASVRGVFPSATLVVPGIRPSGASADDQARTATPGAAVTAGADRIVVGRPITRAPDPATVAEAIAREIETGGPQ